MPRPDASGRLYFEDMEVGRSWVSPRRTLGDADIAAFAGVSGDFNPLHVDEVFAAEAGFGRRVVHGALVFSVATGLRQQMPILLNYREYSRTESTGFSSIAMPH